MSTYSFTGNVTLDSIAKDAGAATPDRIAEWFILLTLGFLSTCLRTYSRLSSSGYSSLGWDDYLVWAGVVWNAMLTMSAYYIGVPYGGMANDDITTARREALAADLYSQEYTMRLAGSKMQIVCWVTYAMTLWCLKASVLCFFVRRLTRNIQGARTNTILGALIIFGTWVILMVATFSSCQPFYKYWQIYPDPGSICYASSSPVLVWTYFVANIGTDAYLTTIPIPVLLRASLTPKQKAAFICLFGCTLVITLISIVRIVLIALDPSDNADGEWAIRESFVAVLTTNLPSTIPLLRRWALFTNEPTEREYVTFNESEGRKSMKLQRVPPTRGGATAGGKAFDVNSPRPSRTNRRDVIYPYPGLSDDDLTTPTYTKKTHTNQEEVGREARLEHTHSSVETKKDLGVIAEETR